MNHKLNTLDSVLSRAGEDTLFPEIVLHRALDNITVIALRFQRPHRIAELNTALRYAFAQLEIPQATYERPYTSAS